VQAFTWIEHGFGGGEVLPLNVVLHDPHQSFRSVARLETLAHASDALDAEPFVKAAEGAGVTSTLPKLSGGLNITPAHSPS